MLRVGTSGDYPPFSVRSADGSYAGFDVAVARTYAADRAAVLELVPFRWPDLERRLLAGDFDVAMSGVTVRGDRLARAPMTAAVARASAVLVVPDREGARGSSVAEDGAGSALAVNRGGHLERVARAALPAATIVALDDNRSLPTVLCSGDVDAAVTDSIELRTFAAERCPARVVRVLAEDRKAYWVAPHAAALAPELDAWLAAREADGTLPALRTRYLGRGAEPASAGLDAAVTRVVDLAARRLLLMPEVAQAKRDAELPIDVPSREAVVYGRARAAAARAGLAEEPYLALVRAQIDAAKAIQSAVLRRRASPDPPADATARQNATTRLDDELRPAIDRIDEALRVALARSAPLAASRAALVDALRRDAPLPGFTPSLARRLAAALRGVRPHKSLERPERPS